MKHLVAIIIKMSIFIKIIKSGWTWTCLKPTTSLKSLNLKNLEQKKYFGMTPPKKRQPTIVLFVDVDISKLGTEVYHWKLKILRWSLTTKQFQPFHIQITIFSLQHFLSFCFSDWKTSLRPISTLAKDPNDNFSLCAIQVTVMGFPARNTKSLAEMPKSSKPPDAMVHGNLRGPTAPRNTALLRDYWPPCSVAGGVALGGWGSMHFWMVVPVSFFFQARDGSRISGINHPGR